MFEKAAHHWRLALSATALVGLYAGLVPLAEAGIFDRLKEMLGSSTEQAAEDRDEPATSQPLTVEEVGTGLKQALSIGVENVVAQLGVTDGFNLDAKAHIPLPGKLDKVRSTLEKLGMSSTFEELELSLNRAAETAVPKSRALLLEAVDNLTLEDALAIYRGPDDAATRYFENEMSAPLQEEMRPLVDASLAEVGAAALYEKVANRYNGLPLVEPVDADLTGYVLGRTNDAIFLYLSQEEAAIRANPLKRSTELLQRLFGRQ